MSRIIKTIIIDDHPIFRRGLRQVIESDADLNIIDEAGDGLAKLEIIETQKPEVAVVDIHMPKMGGLELARTVREKNLPVALVCLTMYRDEDMFNAALDAGVKGYVLKDNAITDIIDCIKTVAAGGHYITPSLSGFLLGRGKKNTDFTRKNTGLESLTKAERRILRLIAEDKTSKEIADRLFVHFRTIDNHRTNISAKLGLRGSHALVRFALKHQSELTEE